MGKGPSPAQQPEADRKNRAAALSVKSAMTTSFFLVIMFTISLVYLQLQDTDRFSTIAGNSIERAIAVSRPPLGAIPNKTEHTDPQPLPLQNKTEYPLECVGRNLIQTCPTNYPTSNVNATTSNQTCPRYFKWIHEDLRPWKSNGITREMVEAGKDLAFFRLVIVDGKPYWEKYQEAYPRNIFTLWGILQLIRLYPGRLPDLDIMFEAGDKPVIKKENYTELGFENAPPMFHYCGDNATLDIAFPDWSFWGWPEIRIKPWNVLKKDLRRGSKKIKWDNRIPHAFWKGNPYMGDRMKLLECNSTNDWNAAIVTQDWDVEKKLGFKTSNLADQCNHRYKIYIEGAAWSVSEKYILACDSMTLLVKPKFYDFFTRSLEPMKHYWHIDPNNTCKSIKFAVEWGNKHPQKAQEIGKRGSKFSQQELQMEHVYDYMFHLLNEYGNLLRYKPTIPPGAMEVCSETLACTVEGLDRQYKMDSMVKGPKITSPCSMPGPEDPATMAAYLDQQETTRRNIDSLVAKGDTQIDII